MVNQENHNWNINKIRST